MGWFIFASIVTLLSAATFWFGAWARKQARKKVAALTADDKRLRTKAYTNGHETLGAAVALRRVGIGALVLCGVWMTALSLTTVPTRNIAVSYAFGKPTGTLDNGLHLIAPWEQTEEYDASIQTLELHGDAGDGRPALNVRIANSATATMDVTVQWQVDPNADIRQLHLDWRNFTALQDQVVRPRLAAALNATFEGFDPLIALKEAGGKPASLGTMEPRVKEHLQGLLPKGLIVQSLMLPFVKYPDAVQNALNDYQKELAATQVAIQQQQTAAAQKAAIEILASANMTPEAFAQQCLVVTERLAQQGKALPAAWNCNVAPTSVVPVR
jgi:regulator of protease activity HflC (stomatin/prohibitin superfamily)